MPSKPRRWDAVNRRRAGPLKCDWFTITGVSRWNPHSGRSIPIVEAMSATARRAIAIPTTGNDRLAAKNSCASDRLRELFVVRLGIAWPPSVLPRPRGSTQNRAPLRARGPGCCRGSGQEATLILTRSTLQRDVRRVSEQKCISISRAGQARADSSASDWLASPIVRLMPAKIMAPKQDGMNSS
jgi:hypothetical protein